MSKWSLRKLAFGFVVGSSMVLPMAAHAGIDDASNAAYSGGWANGSNGGTGFLPWMLNPPVNAISTD